MIWPFSKTLHLPSLFPSSAVDADSVAVKDPFYVARPHIEKSIANALARGDNLVVYGPSHQGKTLLLSHLLDPRNAIYIECRPDFKRTQIYRVALSSLGYAVLVEKKRRGKASATVKLGLASTGAEASAEGELEHVMQAVTVDLKNPSEVAHLIARIKHLPCIVLNNFQLLDSGTKKNLLFDLALFTERPNIRIVIVGSWTNEDYLEEIEPAVAGKFKYVQVPTWTEPELRQAAAQWIRQTPALGDCTPHLAEFLTLSGGDISLFRALVEASVDKDAALGQKAGAASALPIQAMVLGRFRRGLRTKLKTVFAQREAYVTYLAVQSSSRFELNPDFHPTPNLAESDYLRTSIDPYTNQPYSDGRVVLLDENNNPQYLEQQTAEVITTQDEIVRFLLRQFHRAVQQDSNKIDLATLTRAFAEQLPLKPIAVDQAKLKLAFKRFDEVQRQSLIVPRMLTLDEAGEAMEIGDRRLYLYLKSIDLEDLEELLEDAQPRVTPNARRRSLISPEMTEDEQDAYIAKLIPGTVQALGPEQGEEQDAMEDETDDEASDLMGEIEDNNDAA